MITHALGRNMLVQLLHSLLNLLVSNIVLQSCMLSLCNNVVVGVTQYSISVAEQQIEFFCKQVDSIAKSWIQRYKVCKPGPTIPWICDLGTRHLTTSVLPNVFVSFPQCHSLGSLHHHCCCNRVCHYLQAATYVINFSTF